MDEDDPDFSPPGELLQQALRELAGEETQSGRLEREGQNDLTVVGESCYVDVPVRCSWDGEAGPIPEDLADGVNEPFQFGGANQPGRTVAQILTAERQTSRPYSLSTPRKSARCQGALRASGSTLGPSRATQTTRPQFSSPTDP